MNLASHFRGYLYKYIKKSSGDLMVIILINLIPLWGVWVKGWSAMDAIYIYFIETLILCFFAILKMRKSNYILARPNWSKELENKGSKMLASKLKVKIPGTKLATKAFRFLALSGFVLLNIPLAILQIALIIWISGKGFSIFGFLNYDGGHTALAGLKLNTLHIILILLLAEHFYNYYKNYIGKKEYQNTGLLNEGFHFEIRIIIQQIVMIGGLAMILSSGLSKVAVSILILLKTLMDVLSFLYNRYWGSLENKIESTIEQLKA